MNEEEYQAALVRIDELITLSELSALQVEELDDLTDKVVAYEEIHYPLD